MSKYSTCFLKKVVLKPSAVDCQVYNSKKFGNDTLNGVVVWICMRDKKSGLPFIVG